MSAIHEGLPREAAEPRREEEPPATRSPGADILLLQRTAGNQAVAALLAGRRVGRVLQRHTQVALDALADGTEEALDVPGTVAGVAPVRLRLVAGAPAAGNEVSRADFLLIETAWGRFLEDRGGLQMRDANVSDVDYTDRSGTLKTRQASSESPKHAAATGRAGTFNPQKAQMVARIGAEISRSKAARELFIRLVGASDAPATHVVRMFLGEQSAGFYDAQSDFSWDITHEAHVHEDPTDMGGGSWAGVTRGELLMHVLEERYNMVVLGKRYDEAHQMALAGNSLQNQYRAERAKEKGGAAARTSPTVMLDCEPFNARGGAPDPSVAAVFDPAKERELADFVSLDAAANLTRARGIDVKHLFGDMPAPSTTLTTVTSDAAYAAEYFNRAFALCIRDLDEPGEKPKPAFEANINKGRSHFDTIWTMVQGGMRPPPAPGAAPPAATLTPPTAVAQLKKRWTDEVAAAKLRTEARRAAIEAKTATNRGTIETTASDPAVTADPGNDFLLAQRDQRARKVTNEALKHQETNCAACSVGGILLLSSTELMQQFRQDSGHPNPPTAADFIQVKERQDPEAWLKAVTPGAEPHPGTASPNPEVQFQVDIGNAVWGGVQSELTAAAASRNANPQAGGGATWATSVYQEPNMPGSPDYVPARSARPLKTDVIPRMQAYPDGTQFVLWVYAGPPDQMQHYIYAEKLAGHVVIEDLQQNFVTPKRITNRAHVHIDEVPAKPLVPYTTDYFTHGCFVALTPTFTGAGAAAAASPADVRFQTHYRTRPGQDVYVVGSAPELGAWDPQAGLKLEHSGDGIWAGTRTLAIGGRSLHYKYVVLEGSTVIWESDRTGEHHTRRVPAGTGGAPAPAQAFTDSWANFAGV